MARQKLITKEIMRRFAEIGSQDGKGEDAIVVLKLFTPDSNWTWLATEMSYYTAQGETVDVGPELAAEDPKWHAMVSPEDMILFGYVMGLEREWGSFSLGELMKTRGPYGLPIERDAYCGEKTVGEHIGLERCSGCDFKYKKKDLSAADGMFLCPTCYADWADPEIDFYPSYGGTDE